ncbi:winged helix-turn-helix domain-containing protein, partial [Acinetobacter ursingii]|nr:winged helix-turn-helix domain-containing protein [Acinetobacter ursingii]
DCKAHRKEKEFEIIHLHIENINIDSELWQEQFMETINSFAIFNKCSSIKVTEVSPITLKSKMKKLFI